MTEHREKSDEPNHVIRDFNSGAAHSFPPSSPTVLHGRKTDDRERVKTPSKRPEEKSTRRPARIPRHARRWSHRYFRFLWA